MVTGKLYRECQQPKNTSISFATIEHLPHPGVGFTWVVLSVLPPRALANLNAQPLRRLDSSRSEWFRLPQCDMCPLWAARPSALLGASYNRGSKTFAPPSERKILGMHSGRSIRDADARPIVNRRLAGSVV